MILVEFGLNFQSSVPHDTRWNSTDYLWHSGWLLPTPAKKDEVKLFQKIKRLSLEHSRWNFGLLQANVAFPFSFFFFCFNLWSHRRSSSVNDSTDGLFSLSIHEKCCTPSYQPRRNNPCCPRSRMITVTLILHRDNIPSLKPLARATKKKGSMLLKRTSLRAEGKTRGLGYYMYNICHGDDNLQHEL